MPNQAESSGAENREAEELYRRYSRRGRWRQNLKRLVRLFNWILVVQLLSGAKRFLDIVGALALLFALSPVMALVSVVLALQAKVLHRTPRVGRWCETFQEYSFSAPETTVGRVVTRLRCRRLPVLLNILKGDMSFVGPSLISPGELSPRERSVRKRFNVRPGLICLWWIRRRANIAYGGEVESDGEYVDTHTVLGDIGIALRAIPAVIYGEGVATAPDLVTILGIRLNNVTMTEAVETIVERMGGNGSQQICFVNADCANIAYRDHDYHEVIQQAGLVLADGIGLKLAGKLLARDIRQNVNGTDLFPRLCSALSSSGMGLYLLGGRPGVAEGVRDWLAQEHPEVKVSGYHHGYFTSEEEPEVIGHIADSGAKLLLVALGAPRQDMWISENLERTGVRVAMGVGGLFDFYSGRTPRAPQWMREMGLEWLYRFGQEPGRMWKRYFVGNALFLIRVIKARFK